MDYVIRVKNRGGRSVRMLLFCSRRKMEAAWTKQEQYRW